MRSRIRTGVRRLALALTVAVVAGACSDDPSGPGSVELEVRGPVPLGAAVVEITGAGVTGVDQPTLGWAELVPVAPSGSTPVHRLILIQDEQGRLQARLQLLDVAAPLPVVTVVEATDALDRPLPVSGSLVAVLSR